MDKDRLLEMSVELAKAHLSTSQVSTAHVPQLVRDIFGVLASLSSAEGENAPLATADEVIPADNDLRSEPRVLNEDVTSPDFQGLDPWLAARIPRRIAVKLNREPSVHPSVFEDHIICLEDGESVTLLRSYLRKRFDISIAEYVDRWNLPDAFPTAPPAYLAVKRAHANAYGLGTRLRGQRGPGRVKRGTKALA